MNHPTPELFLRETAWLRRIAIELAGNAAVADDLVQDTWLAAVRRHWPDGLPSRPWLRRVVKNLASTRRRGDRRRRARESEVARAEAAEADRDVLERMEAQRWLTEAICRLDEDSRLILALRFQEGMRQADIAKHLGVPAGTVRSRSSRALQQLRGELERDGRDLRAGVAPLLVAPFARPGVTVVRTEVLAAAAAVLLSAVLLPIVLWPKGHSDEAEQVAAAEVLSVMPARAPGAVPDRPEREIVPAMLFGTAPGWWIEGVVRGPRGLGGKPARVRVADARGKSERVVEGRSGADGKIEIDVGAILRDPEHLITELFVDVDHPEHLPARLRVKLSRKLRQIGFRGARGRIPVRFDLVPGKNKLRGRIRVPVGHDVRRVRVATVERHRLKRPRRNFVDACSPDEHGSFELRAAPSKQTYVVAWLRGTHDAPRGLRPGHVLTASSSSDLVEISLGVGSSITGVFDTGEHACSVPFRIDVYTDEPLLEGAYDEVESKALAKLLGEGAVSYDLVPRAIRGRPLADVAWMGEEFGYPRASGFTGPRGRFKISGLRPGVEFFLDRVELIDARGRVVPTTGPGFDTLECTTPKDGFRIPAPGVLSYQRRSLKGVPLAKQLLFYKDTPKRRWALRNADQDGRFAIWSQVRSGTPTYSLWFLGCEPEVDREFPPYVRQDLAVKPSPGSGSLTLEVEGDVERRIEGFALLLKADPKNEGQRFIGFRDGHDRKRLDGPMTFSGIPAGRYTARLLPADKWHRCDFHAFHCESKFVVDIAPGANRRTLRLQPGGFAHIPDPRVLAKKLALGGAGGGLLYRMLDPRGAVIDARVVQVSPEVGVTSIPEKPTPRIPLDQPCRFHPVLPAGEYTLEVRASKGAKPVRLPFRVVAGEATEIVGE